MNIAVINTLARSKSTGKIAYGLYRQLKQSGHQAILCYGRPDEGVDNDPDIIRINDNLDNYVHGACARLLGDQGRYSRRSTAKLLQILDEHHVEAVYLFNLHGYFLNFPMLFSYLGKRQIKTIYVMLDDYPFLGKCCFSLDCEKFKTECTDCPQVHEYPKSLFLDRSNTLFHMKESAYRQVQDLTFVGIPYTVARAKESALLKNANFAELDEAVDLRGMYYPRDTAALRSRLGIPPENKVIVTVSPFTDPRKGGQYFLEAARMLQARKDLTFVHVGFNGDTSLCPPNEIPIGYVTDQNELAEYYSLGDLFVCTSLAETVANTCLEALSCGTPLLSFNTSGMPYCADAQHGAFVPVRDSAALAAVIEKVEKKTPERIASCRAYAESRYDAAVYYQKLEKLLYSSCSE